jgi:hypothetical protein
MEQEARLQGISLELLMERKVGLGGGGGRGGARQRHAPFTCHTDQPIAPPPAPCAQVQEAEEWREWREKARIKKLPPCGQVPTHPLEPNPNPKP